MKTQQVWVLASVAMVSMASLAGTKYQVKAPPPDINPAHFVREVDNEFFPLWPGTTFIYKGTDGEGPRPRRPGDQHGRLLGSRSERRAAGHHHEGQSASGRSLPSGVRPGRGGGYGAGAPPGQIS